MAAPIINFGRGTIALGITASPSDQYECQIQNFTITPSANLIQVAGTYCEGPTTLAQKSTYAIDLTWLSDWGSDVTNSLSQLLWDNDGEPLYFEFTPEAATLPTATGQVIGQAGTFGGPGDNIWQNTTSLPCTAKPVLTPRP